MLALHLSEGSDNGNTTSAIYLLCWSEEKQWMLSKTFEIASTMKRIRQTPKFKGAGISVALVFRSLQDEAIAEFCVNTNRCHWKKDDKLEPKLRSCVKK
jgi:hypothetical protein